MNSLSLYKLSILILVALLLMATSFGIGAVRLLSKVDDINDSWLSFRSQHAEKARLINALSGSLGFGGMIHDFKNYILRKDFKHLSRLEQSMGGAQSIVKQYVALSSTPAEKLVLNDLEEMLNAYQEGIKLIRLEIEKNTSSSDIDKLVQTNDLMALRALNVLRNEVIDEYPYYNDQQQKPVLAATLRLQLGYGGMVHAYKNYILRNEKKYRDKALSSMLSIEQTITKYYQLDPSTGETTALEDISSVINQYRTNIKLVDEGIKKNLTPEQIDFNVKIDDSYALRGLMTLDQDNINQIEVKSSQLSLMIMEVIEAEKLNGIVVISFTAFIAGFIFWVFSNKIIRPVKHLSMLMHEMSQGNLNIKLNSSHENSRFTEIDMMKRSLHVFKESETKRREAEEEIRHLALTDPLTGLANRNQFESRYNEMIAMAKRENKLLAYLALDLDNFKPINDEYGHLAGDLILKSVAKHLIMAFRETDLIARMGGDEFSVILFGPENQESVEMVCKRVIALIKTPVAFGKDMLSVGISIGIAMHTPEDEDNLELLLGSGDKALYEAKQSGRNTYRVFNAS